MFLCSGVYQKMAVDDVETMHVIVVVAVPSFSSREQDTPRFALAPPIAVTTVSRGR